MLLVASNLFEYMLRHKDKCFLDCLEQQTKPPNLAFIAHPFRKNCRSTKNLQLRFKKVFQDFYHANAVEKFDTRKRSDVLSEAMTKSETNVKVNMATHAPTQSQN